MTPAVVRRLLPATIIAILFHWAVLSYQLRQTRLVPAPPAMQQIKVSLGVSPPKKQASVSKKPEIMELIQPKSKPRRIVPARTTQRLVKTKQIIEEVAEKKPPQDTQKPAVTNNRKEVIPSPDSTPAAARVVQQATPLYRLNPPPKYPRLARRRGQQGLVLLEALIDINGKVKRLRLLKSSGYAALDQAAHKAASLWRFSPGSIDGKAEEMTVKVPVRFSLN